MNAGGDGVWGCAGGELARREVLPTNSFLLEPLDSIAVGGGLPSHLKEALWQAAKAIDRVIG